MSQFLRNAPKMGTLQTVTIAPENNSRVTVPNTDPLNLQKTVVARINTLPEAGQQFVELLVTDMNIGTVVRVHVDCRVTIDATRSLYVVWNSDDDIHTFALNGMSEGSVAWVDLRYNGASGWTKLAEFPNPEGGGAAKYYMDPVEPVTLTSFESRRATMLSAARYPAALWTPVNVSGTTSGGTEATSFHPNLSIDAATAGQTRLYNNVGSTGPVWPGLMGVPDFARKCVVNAVWVTQLSAHADSRISIHFTQTGVTTHTSHDRSVEGISVLFRGGASAGTVELQCHDGSAFSNSATAVFPINDTTGYSWTLEHEPGVAVRLYKNGVLQCTATANLPSGTTAGTANQGMVIIAGNVAGGTGNATKYRLCDMQLTEVP